MGCGVLYILIAENSNVPEIILLTVSNRVTSTFPVYWLLVIHSCWCNNFTNSFNNRW